MQSHSKAERIAHIQGGLKVKYDCFAYDPEIGCKALDELHCLSGKCNFYKTEAQMCEACNRAKGRVTSCQKCKQIRFAG